MAIALSLAICLSFPATAQNAGIAAYKKKDSTTALHELTPDTEAGDAKAQFDLGYLYRRGEGMPQDDLKAVHWWQKAVNQGDTFAQSSLARMYLDGNGVKKNLIRAYKWSLLAEPHPPGQSVRWNWFSVQSIAKMMKATELAKAQKLAKEWTRAQRK